MPTADDEVEVVGDIATEYGHVRGREIGKDGVLSADRDRLQALAGEQEGTSQEAKGRLATQAGQTHPCWRSLEGRQDGGQISGQDRAIRGCVKEEPDTP